VPVCQEVHIVMQFSHQVYFLLDQASWYWTELWNQ